MKESVFKDLHCIKLQVRFLRDSFNETRYQNRTYIVISDFETSRDYYWIINFFKISIVALDTVFFMILYMDTY